MALWSGVIVGFDHDTPAIFDTQYEFLQASRIPLPLVHLLTAPPGTRLWHRMRREGRLLAGDEEPVMPKPTTNIIPGGMTRLELLKGHLELYDRLRGWDAWAERMIGFVSQIRCKPAIRLSGEAARRQRRRERLGQLLGRMERGPGDWLLAWVYRLLRLRAGGRTRGLIALEPKARKAILRVIRHTIQRAPWMFPETLGPLIIMQLRQVELLRQGRPLMVEQIERERAPGFEPQLAGSGEVIPENFPAVFQSQFGQVYARVAAQLEDQSRIEEALIEIFVRLLLGGEQVSLDGLESVSSSVIAECNRQPRNGLVALGPRPSADFRKSKLPEEILHGVEQKLRLRAHDLVASQNQ
jgi:hypothetical protein